MKLNDINTLKESIQIIGKWMEMNPDPVEFWITDEDECPVMNFSNESGLDAKIYEHDEEIQVFLNNEFQMSIPIDAVDPYNMDLLDVVNYLAGLIKDEKIPHFTSCEWI